jgi:type IV pilus assembly protein PilF
MLQERLREPRKAEEYYQRAIELDADNADYSNTYGIFLCRQGRLADAERAFVSAANNPLYQTPEFAWDNAALCALDAQQPDRAAEHARAALRNNPRFSPALLHMAQAQFALGQMQLADAYLQRHDKYARSGPASLWLGIQIARVQGDAAAAQRIGQQLLNSYPQSAEAGRYLESR